MYNMHLYIKIYIFFVRVNDHSDFMKLIRTHSLPCSCNSAPSYRNCIHQLYTSFSGAEAVLRPGEIHLTEELLCTMCQAGCGMHWLQLLVTPKGRFFCAELQRRALQREVRVTNGFWETQNFFELSSLAPTTFISSLKERIRGNLFSGIIKCIWS